MQAPVDVKDWTRFHDDQRHPFWWGILCLITIEVMVLAGFLLSFFFLWIVNVSEGRMGWPPPGTELPPLLYPSIECVLLLVCGWTMWDGGREVKKEKNMNFVWLVVICTLAGLAVLALRWMQLAQLPYDWKENTYASFVWFLTGFHFMHVLAAVVGTMVLGWLAYKDYYTPQRVLGIQIDTMYWYYVVGGWFPIYFVLYWAPRLI